MSYTQGWIKKEDVIKISTKDWTKFFLYPEQKQAKAYLAFTLLISSEKSYQGRQKKTRSGPNSDKPSDWTVQKGFLLLYIPKEYNKKTVIFWFTSNATSTWISIILDDLRSCLATSQFLRWTDRFQKELEIEIIHLCVEVIYFRQGRSRQSWRLHNEKSLQLEKKPARFFFDSSGKNF